MKKNEMKKAAPAVPVWKASETYTLAGAQSAGDNARKVTIGYLLILSKLDPKCTRRDSRRQGLPLSTAIHGCVWQACLNRSAALPGDTAMTAWDKAIADIYNIGLAAYADKAAAARKARADKKAEAQAEAQSEAQSEAPAEAQSEAPAADHELNPVRAAVAGLIAAIAGLPVEQRAETARKACQAIMAKFE